MSDQMPNTESIRRAGKAALKRRRLLKELNRTDVQTPQPRVPEHYHLVYAHPGSEVIIANYEERFDSQVGAFKALQTVGRAAEPNVEWYEDGQIGFETRVHGSTGQHWVIASVGMCHRRNCVRSKPVIEIVTR